MIFVFVGGKFVCQETNSLYNNISDDSLLIRSKNKLLTLFFYIAQPALLTLYVSDKHDLKNRMDALQNLLPAFP